MKQTHSNTFTNTLIANRSRFVKIIFIPEHLSNGRFKRSRIGKPAFWKHPAKLRTDLPNVLLC
jgi:hypothetical protein